MNDWKQITKSNYDLHANEFASFSKIYRGKMQKWIGEFTQEFKKGAEILDVGCGAGRDAMYLSSKGLEVTGIDYSNKLIDIAKKKVPGVKFIVMDFEDLKFSTNSFDGVWANACLYHLPKKNLPKVLDSIHKILKEEGLFFIDLRAGEGEKFTNENRGNAMLRRYGSYYNPKEAEDMLHEAGFKSVAYELDSIEAGPKIIVDWIAFFARK